MKKIFFVIMGLGILFLASGQPVKAQGVSEEKKATADTAKGQDVGNKICPVTGEKINEGTKATYEYEGKIYNFCCPMCIGDFKKDPQKYIKKVQEELKAESKNKTEEQKEAPETMHEGHNHSNR